MLPHNAVSRAALLALSLVLSLAACQQERNNLGPVHSGMPPTAAEAPLNTTERPATSAETPVASAAEPVNEREVIKSPNDSRDYAALTLPNGLDVLLVSDPSVKQSAAALSVGVGLLEDPMDYQGMAHYLEHMLFLGTEKYPEPDGYMEFVSQHGGQVNAYTWLDITNYMLLIDNSAYDEALDRFSDFFKKPLLLPEYIDKEKNAVNAEWSMRREMDFFSTYRIDRSLLGEHPANRFLIGNLESLADKPGQGLHEATVAFYERYYSANLMKVAMVSPLPLAQMEDLARKHFAAIENREVPRPQVDVALDIAAVGAKRVRYVPQEDQRQLRLDFIIEDNRDTFRNKPNAYLAYILGSEMPSTPAAWLKEQGWASQLVVYDQPSAYGNYGTFSISVDLTPEGMAQREQIVHTLLGYVQMLRDNGISERYAEEFNTSLANRFRFLEKINDFSYVSQLAANMQDYPLAHVIDADYRFEGLDQPAMQAVLDQLTPERLRVWYISREEQAELQVPFYAGRYAVEPLALPQTPELLAAATEAGLALPALNTLLPDSFEVAHGPAQPQRVVNEPGLEVWLQGSAEFADQPRGLLQLYVNTDARQQSAAGSVLLDLWGDLYRQAQTTWFTEASVAGMSAMLSADEGLRLSVSGFTDRQQDFLAPAIEALRVAPSEQALAQAVDRYLRALENEQRGFVVRQLSPALGRLTRTGRYSEASLRAAAKAVTLNSFNAFVAQTLQRNHLRAYLFGNYGEADAQALATLLAAQFEQREPQPYVRSQVLKPVAGTALVYNLDIPVEDLGMFYLFVAREPGFSEQAYARVLSDHISNRAFNTLRTEEQLGYAAGAMGSQLGEHASVGFYIQTPVKPPVEMLERFQRFALEEYPATLEALTEEEFATLRAAVLRDLTEPSKTLRQEAGPYLSDWSRERYAFDSRARLIAAVEATTLEGLRAFYADTVLAEDAASVLLQLRGQRFAEMPYARLPGAQVVFDLTAFHAAMPVQEDMPAQELTPAQ